MILISGALCSGYSQSQNESTASATGIHPTPLWAAAQLVPSIQWHFPENQDSRFGLRWQVTPLLYSFGINKQVSPWRSLIIEPMTRYNGSAELYIAPEYASDMPVKWTVRAGIRAYYPLYQYGEYLAASLGTSFYDHAEHAGVSIEGGLYIFFGILGMQVEHSPAYQEAPWTFRINIRYF